jgi:hypothetical protein
MRRPPRRSMPTDSPVHFQGVTPLDSLRTVIAVPAARSGSAGRRFLIIFCVTDISVGVSQTIFSESAGSALRNSPL